jgi:hypothetical protein
MSLSELSEVPETTTAQHISTNTHQSTSILNQPHLINLSMQQAWQMDYSDFISNNNTNPNSSFSVKNILQPDHQTMQYAAAYSAAYNDPYGQQSGVQQSHGFPMDPYAASSFQYGNSGYHTSSSHSNAAFNGLYSVPYLNAAATTRTSNHGHHHHGSSVSHLPLTSPHVQQLYDLKPPTSTALNAEALISELTSQSGNDKRK